MTVQYKTSNPMVDENNMASKELIIFCSQLRDSINNVTAITNSVSVEGDLNIVSTNIQFYNTTWPLDNPGTGFVLVRDENLAMSWEDPDDITLAPETGKIEMFFGSSAPTGWILYDGGTIGSATSGATTRANADTNDLFVYLWDLFDNTVCPVSTGRGASAQADFDANKTISITNLAARLLAVYSETYTHMTKQGETTYYLTKSQLPNHEHPTWYREPLGGGTLDPTSYAVLNQDNLGKSGSHTGSFWTDEFQVNLSKYDSVSFTQFSVAQPSVNVNMIIKL